MTALEELRKLHDDESPSVFGVTANTSNCRVKAAGLGESFSGHSGRMGLARRMAARTQRAGLGGHAAGPMVQQYDGGEVHSGESVGDGARWLE